VCRNCGQSVKGAELTESNPTTEISTARWRNSPWLGFAEIFAAGALIVGDYFGWVPISSTPFFLVLAWLSLRLRRRKWRDIGFSRPKNWYSALLIGCLAGAAMELFSTFVTVPFLSAMSGSPPDLSEFESIVGNIRLLFIWLAISWLLAAFGEELAYRGYLMNRFAEVAGASKGAWLFSLVLVSVLFGVGHGNQGITGIVQEGFAGFLLGIIFLLSGRNLAIPIVAHGVANTIAFVLIYFDRYPGV
jgi:membrane protease YdiL (CAAX protease family)